MSDYKAKTDALAKAAEAADAYRAAKRDRVDALLDAHEAGASWREIGHATGMAGGTAHQLTARFQRAARAA